MSYAAFVTRRAAFAVLAAFLVVSLTFTVVAATPNPQLGAKIAAANQAGASDQRIREIREEFWEKRGGKRGILARYVDHVVGVATLDWGTSYALQKPVTGVLAKRIPYTLAYVVPGILLSLLFGSVVGVVNAFRRNGVFDRSTRVAAYFLMGLPAFWVVHFLDEQFPWTMPWLLPTRTATTASPRIPPYWSFDHALRYAWPTLVLALGLTAALLQHSRAESLEYTHADFVKLLRAKGASRLRVARHVLRNAALPILTMSFVEIIGVLMLNIYIIEAVFNIPGLGTISLYAIENKDTPLIIGTTMLLVLIGIGGNLLLDLAYGYLDPTIRED